MPSMPLRSLPAPPGQHHYDFDPTPSRPVVRVYPAISWLPGHQQPCWVRDDGEDRMDTEVVGAFTPGCSHRIDDDEPTVGNCDTCEQPAYAWDDFFGYMCPLHEIKLRLRYKARGVNPWGGKL